MRRFLCVALFATALCAADKSPVPRQVMESVERGFDKSLAALDVNDPFDIIGLTRGLYLDGYGAVFTTETNLVISTFSPFATVPDKAGIGRLHQKKVARLALLRNAMRQHLLAAGSALQAVPPGEQVVVAVTLMYKSYEQREGLPDQIVMQAPRQTLVDIKSGRAAESAIRIQER